MTKKSLNTKIARNSGATLVEIIAALGVVSAGVMGVVQMHFQDMRQTRALQEEYVAARLIENEWAYVQAAPGFLSAAGEGKFRHGFDDALLRELHTQANWKKRDGGDLLELRLEVRWFSTLGRLKNKEAAFLLLPTPSPQGESAVP